MGNHATKFETLEGNTYIAKNDRLLTLAKKDWKDPSAVYKLQPGFSYAKCIGNYIYLIGDSQITRYLTSPENLFSE